MYDTDTLLLLLHFDFAITEITATETLLLLLLPEKGSVLLCLSSLALLSLQAFKTRRDTEREDVFQREKGRRIGGENADSDESIR